MKLILRILCSSFMCFSLAETAAQCPAGYTSAQLNWDHLDYYYNSGSKTGPYGYNNGTYISDVQAQTQKFAIGTTWLSIVASSNNFVNGENATHTGNLAGYAGEDAQFTPSANGQTLTITFATEVQDVSFALYDIDAGARFDITAQDNALTAKNISAAFQATTILSAGTTNNSTALTITATSGTSGNASNNGTAVISIAGGVKQVVIKVTTRGNDPIFWLSDINACVSGSFPVDYHKTDATRPFNGQPQYFIVTPDNNSAYMVDAATGRAKVLFRDAANTYINSFAYDAQNHILYYVSESASATASNKQLKKYDFNTETIGVVMADIGAELGIPTFEQGLQSGGACFYDGALYLGVEGGQFSSSITRESIIWKIEFNAALQPVNAYQVWAIPAYNTSTGNSNHDWGDFMIRDGMLYDFNTARQGSGTFTYPNSAFHHYNMMTGAMTTQTNPNARVPYVGQAAMDWSGNLYSIRNAIEKYNEDGTLSAAIPITVTDGPAWVGNAGDASEPFRPKADFGDAPASYDPDPFSSAVHEMDVNLKLGNAFDREWEKKTSLLSDGDSGDDGLPFVSILNTGAGNYQTDVRVFNNTGKDAIVCGWIDFNNNGTFEPGEGIESIVPSSGSLQTISLYWNGINAKLPSNSYTVLRLRVTSLSNGMTREHPTGYFANGEVEDYRVIVNITTLNTHSIQFKAIKENGAVQLMVDATEDHKIAKYIIARSSDGIRWNPILEFAATGAKTYLKYDGQPLTGQSYYRLQVIEHNGQSSFSDIKAVTFGTSYFELKVVANPVRDVAILSIHAAKEGSGMIEIYDLNGQLAAKQNINIQKGYNQKAMPVSHLPAGQYIIQVRHNEWTERRRFIIAR